MLVVVAVCVCVCVCACSFLMPKVLLIFEAAVTNSFSLGIVKVLCSTCIHDYK